jgi:phosphotransferase system HPr-like phosphotransfer protein
MISVPLLHAILTANTAFFMKENLSMRKFTIHLKSINDVKEFVRIVNEFPYDVDLASGRYIVDAKSIMGIFSLDLAKPIDVEIQSDEGQDLEDELRQFMI